MIDLKYGFVKTAAATPKIRVADCEYNANQIIACVKEAYKKGASLVVFPELCVTGYTCSDLFLQSTLLKAAEKAVLKIKNETKSNIDIEKIMKQNNLKSYFVSETLNPENGNFFTEEDLKKVLEIGLNALGN